MLLLFFKKIVVHLNLRQLLPHAPAYIIDDNDRNIKENYENYIRKKYIQHGFIPSFSFLVSIVEVLPLFIP